MTHLSPIVAPTGIAAAIAKRNPDAASEFTLTGALNSFGAMMSGMARPVVLGRFASVSLAMLGADAVADEMHGQSKSQILAILDREQRLVLAGSAGCGAIEWCKPVTTAAEARAVVWEASRLRAQALRVADDREFDRARRLRNAAALLEARLVDPIWRSRSARILQDLGGAGEAETGGEFARRAG